MFSLSLNVLVKKLQVSPQSWTSKHMTAIRCNCSTKNPKSALTRFWIESMIDILSSRLHDWRSAIWNMNNQKFVKAIYTLVTQDFFQVYRAFDMLASIKAHPWSTRHLYAPYPVSSRSKHQTDWRLKVKHVERWSSQDNRKMTNRAWTQKATVKISGFFETRL